MIGVGLTPEGIEQNDIIYDFMMETIWYTSPVDLDKWVTNFVHRKYGFINQDIINGWHLLQYFSIETNFLGSEKKQSNLKNNFF
jgi:alpha-N-acetylglucosaminidase